MKSRLVLALLTLLSLTGFSHSVTKEGDHYSISHQWRYQGREWAFTMEVSSDLYEYYQGRKHMSDNVVEYVLSDYDRVYVQSLVNSFREGGEKASFSDWDNVGNVISFVQSLQYVYDEESKGEEDYIRFPVETLVDGVGDCEDMAILAAAILDGMGYPVLMVSLPDHLALALHSDESVDGTYYEYEGARYYYVEVTSVGWGIGQIPKEYQRSGAKLIPLVHRPRMRFGRCSFEHDTYYSTDEAVPIVFHCEIENVGPGTTEELSLRFLVKPHEYSDMAYVERVFPLDEMGEGSTATYEVTLLVPRPLQGIMEIRVEGSNFDTDSMMFHKVVLK